MKKVLFIAHVESHILNFHLPFLKLFSDEGYEVHVATNGNKTIPFCDVHHNICFERSPLNKNNIKAYRELKEIIRNNHFDVVHCHTPVGGVLGRLAAAKSKGTRIIYTAHGFHFYKGAPLLNWLLYYPIERFIAHYTDTLITINEEDTRCANTFHLREQGEVFMIDGIGIDINQIDEVTPVEIKRQELGIKNEDILLVTAGELNKNKNQKVIIEALAKLDKPNYKLLICGSGQYLDKLHQYSIELGVENQVIFGGYRTDLIEVYKSSDMFVFPSLREGLPIALLQAIACNLPCAVSNIRGNIDLIKYCSYGYTFDPRNSDELANIIEEHDFNEQVTRNQDIFRFDIKQVIKRMKEIYNIQ